MAKRTVRQNNARLTFTKVNEAEQELAERNFAKSEALVAGASKLLNDHIAGTSWGPGIAIDVAMELLAYAKETCEFAFTASTRARK